MRGMILAMLLLAADAGAQAPPGLFQAKDSLIVRHILDLNHKESVAVHAVVDVSDQGQFIGFTPKGLGLTTLPAEIGQMPFVNFFASGNKLSSLPDEMNGIFQLRNIVLDSNAFTVLPGKLDSVNEVWSISLRYNQITAVTDADVNRLGLKKLVMLNLNDNKIDTLGPALGRLGALTVALRGNRLRSLPEEFIASKTNLVDVDSNRICHPSAALAAWISSHNYNGTNKDWQATQYCADPVATPPKARPTTPAGGRPVKWRDAAGRAGARPASRAFPE